MAYTRKHVKERFRPKPGRLLDQVREIMRYHHYAIRTEQTYIKWMLDYIRFNGTRHPREMGKPEIERFLSHLAVNGVEINNAPILRRILVWIQGASRGAYRDMQLLMQPGSRIKRQKGDGTIIYFHGP